jgi:TRAP-type C4-dicarboxylate transport system permease small subunit
MAASTNAMRAGLARSARFVIQTWALFGGALLCAVVLMNVYSVLSAAFVGRPFPGDFELTEVGVAIAVFAFLPYCQLTGANVTADIFTSGASARMIAVLKAVAAIVALCFSAILVWRMSAGLLDQMAYGYTTTILQFPHWVAFIPILFSLVLLAIASLMTATDALHATRGSPDA